MRRLVTLLAASLMVFGAIVLPTPEPASANHYDPYSS